MFLKTSLSPLNAESHAALLAELKHAADPESRTRFQMILLAVERDLPPSQIAPLVHRSRDPVLRVLQPYQARDLAAVPRKMGPGPMPKVTATWEKELLVVIDADPQEFGVASVN